VVFFTILAFFLIALLALGIGHFSKRIELYFFGIIIMLFMGLFMINNGVAEQTGESIAVNQTVVGNETMIAQTTTFVYEENQNVWTNGIGLLSVIIAGGLSLTWFRMRKAEKDAEMQGADL